MQKLSETPDRKRGDAGAKKESSWQKKEACPLSAVTSGRTKPESFLLLIEGTIYPFLDDTLDNLSISNSHLTTKNLK